MTDYTEALLKLSEQVGANTEATRTLQRTVTDNTAAINRRVDGVEVRVNDLEADRDRRAGAEEAAAKALARVDFRIRVLGAIVGVVGAVDVVTRIGH